MMCTWRGGGNIDSETDHKTSSLVTTLMKCGMQCGIISKKDPPSTE